MIGLGVRTNKINAGGATPPPVNTVAPVVSGNAVVGQTLTTTNGTWSNTPTSYTYQWYRGASAIGSATSSTYVLVQADASNTSNIKCVVTATNAAGSASADSNTVAQVLTVRTNSFLTASGITDTTIKGGLNTFDIGLISNSLDSKMHLIYPFVGGTASTHKWNFMDARDLDAAFRAVFNGTITHDANGITGNGTNGYVSTKYIPSVNQTISSASFGTYDRTNSSAVGRYTSGALSGGNASWLSYNNDTQYGYLGGGVNVVANGSTNPITRLRLLTRTSSTSLKAFRDGSQVGSTATGSITALPNVEKFLLATNGVGGIFSDHNLAFHYEGLGLSDAQVTTFNTLVNSLQTTLGRNV